MPRFIATHHWEVKWQCERYNSKPNIFVLCFAGARRHRGRWSCLLAGDTTCMERRRPVGKKINAIDMEDGEWEIHCSCCKLWLYKTLFEFEGDTIGSLWYQRIRFAYNLKEAFSSIIFLAFISLFRWLVALMRLCAPIACERCFAVLNMVWWLLISLNIISKSAIFLSFTSCTAFTSVSMNLNFRKLLRIPCGGSLGNGKCNNNVQCMIM